MTDTEKLAALEAQVQKLGDAAADVIDQMLKGSWRDDMGHDVRRNVAVIELKDQLGAMIAFRAEHMGYSR